MRPLLLPLPRARKHSGALSFIIHKTLITSHLLYPHFFIVPEKVTGPVFSFSGAPVGNFRSGYQGSSDCGLRKTGYSNPEGADQTKSQEVCVMQNIEFSVKDMDCKSCVNVILKKLKAFEGVKDVKIDPATKKVKVEWDNPKVCDSDLTCAVEDLGYKVSMD
jgi:copper chaperone CopZ